MVSWGVGTPWGNFLRLYVTPNCASGSAARAGHAYASHGSSHKRPWLGRQGPLLNSFEALAQEHVLHNIISFYESSATHSLSQDLRTRGFGGLSPNRRGKRTGGGPLHPFSICAHSPTCGEPWNLGSSTNNPPRIILRCMRSLDRSNRAQIKTTTTHFSVSMRTLRVYFEQLRWDHCLQVYLVVQRPTRVVRWTLLVFTFVTLFLE